jgi:hypothetical protein
MDDFNVFGMLKTEKIFECQLHIMKDISINHLFSKLNQERIKTFSNFLKKIVRIIEQLLPKI